MRRFAPLLIAIALLICSSTGWTAPLEISLASDMHNPPSPQMGDQLKFRSMIVNTGTIPAHGVVAWISLVQIDPNHEQPMDLEDWSAHKAVTQATLAPGQQVVVEWPMRLIQAGNYRVVISAVERNTPHIITSPFVDFHVNRKPVVESKRILPVAFGVPLVFAVMMILRLRRT